MPKSPEKEGSEVKKKKVAVAIEFAHHQPLEGFSDPPLMDLDHAKVAIIYEGEAREIFRGEKFSEALFRKTRGGPFRLNLPTPSPTADSRT